MVKIITVWGNPDYGRSMSRCALAKVLTAGKQEAIIINADSTTPMFPVWMPGRVLEQDASVGGVLPPLDTNSAPITERMAVPKDYPSVGVMGYTAGEIPFSYPEPKYDRTKLLISEASRPVDHITLNCSSSVMNFLTPTTIGSANVVVRILTPDLRGIDYLRAHKPLLIDAKLRYDEHLTFAELARPSHALDEMGHSIGGFDGILPYAKEIERYGTSGEMFRTLAYCNQRYINSMELIRQRLETGEVSQEVDTVQEEEIPDE